MILQLKVPFMETFARGGEVARWEVAEGDKVEFGDPICVILLSEWVFLRKPKRAAHFALVDTKSAARHEFEIRSDSGAMSMKVVASEAGILRRISAPVGTKVMLGDHLALFSTDAGEELPKDHSAAPTMRVVATE